MFGFARKRAHREVSAAQLQILLNDGAAAVVDVREPDEFASGHIPGASNVPLSRFDGAALPDAGGKKLVLSCAGGKRSAVALDRCVAAGSAVDTHLAGGFGAWKSAGLAIEK